MTRHVVAVEFARAYFEDNPPVKMDGRDFAYLYIAAQLLQKNPPLEKRLQAIDLLEQELFPNGRRDSLALALGGRRPARRPRKRGGDPLAYKTRDFCIVHVISELCKRFKLKPLRNRTAKDKGKADSACSVVVEALRLVDVHMTEGAVEKIWNGRHNLWPADDRSPPKGFPV